ncbi:DNA mismatch repair protein MutS, partial [bacterium]|nr:DNA mismatch repair protein MutS [bacterium]
GDFYEMFYEDAVTASKVLGLTLTSRAHGKDTEKVPLAGFPYHSVDTYLSKMLKAGYRVAICEQVEDPKLTKGIVKRSIVERISPGTTYSDKLLDEKSNNFLGSIYIKDNNAGIAAIDVTTGDYLVAEGSVREMAGRLETLNPAEVVVPESMEKAVKDRFNGRFHPLFTVLDDYVFTYDYAYETLINHFKTNSLKGFGCEELHFGIASAGAVLHYLLKTQGQKLDHVNKIQPIFSSHYMILDSATRYNLELIYSMGERGKATSLLSVVDHTETPMGGRTLKSWIINPLRDLNSIRERISAVEELLNNESSRKRILSELKGTGDVERIQTKICTGRVNARELLYLAKALKKIPVIKEILKELRSPYMSSIDSNLNNVTEITDEIERAIKPEPPLQITEGGVIRDGYNAELDEIRAIFSSGRKWITNMQSTERKRTGINSLKISFN